MNYQSFLLPLLFIAFVVYQIIKAIKIKKQLPELIQNGAIIIDVRSIGEYQAGHNPNSINIPLDQLHIEFNKLDKTKTYILCCASGTRSGAAKGFLRSKGFTNLVNAGPWSRTILK